MPNGSKGVGGRPRKELDAGAAYKLGQLGCTDAEIAAFFGVSDELVRQRKRTDPEFLGALEKGRATMKLCLRRKQLRVALRGNVPMLIWLGKQLLGQSDQAQDAPPPRPREEVVLPAPLSSDEYAEVVERLRKRGALPGTSEIS
jgi:hypothetical protein